MILKANRTCPYCGKEIFAFEENDWKYGSPIKNCTNCKKRYMDPRYHEIAIDGLAPDAFDIKQSVKVMIIGLVMAVVMGGANLGFLYKRGYYYFILVVFSLVGVLITVVSAADIIRIKTGSKERYFERLKEESEERLQDSTYVQELQEAGILVPEKDK